MDVEKSTIMTTIGPPQKDTSCAKDMMHLMAKNLEKITQSIDNEDFDRFLSEIHNARQVFVIGAGRSGLVASAFAMRLIHLGIPTFVVGESILPTMTEGSMMGDIVVVFSCSGGTGIAAQYATDAKTIGGARVCLITSQPKSPVSAIADCTILFKEHLYQKQCVEEGCSLFAPLGTLFETTAWVFADAVVSGLMEVKGIDAGAMWSVHANLMGLFVIPEKDPQQN